jgi:hypothetical protein
LNSLFSWSKRSTGVWTDTLVLSQGWYLKLMRAISYVFNLDFLLMWHVHVQFGESISSLFVILMFYDDLSIDSYVHRLQ